MNLIFDQYFCRPGAHNVKLRALAGSVAPGSSTATISQKGINIGKFAQDVNERAKNWLAAKSDEFNELSSSSGGDSAALLKMPLLYRIRIYQNKTYDARVRKPTVSMLIKKLGGFEKCSSAPGKVSAGKIKRSLLAQIAKFKLDEISRDGNEEAALKCVIGTAVSMGLTVIS